MKKFIERLIICWHVLTKKNYIYFGVSKDPIIWDQSFGRFKQIRSDNIAFYCSVDEDYKFKDYKGDLTNLHNVVWSCVEDIAKEAQKGKY